MLGRRGEEGLQQVADDDVLLLGSHGGEGSVGEPLDRVLVDHVDIVGRLKLRGRRRSTRERSMLTR